MEAYWVMITREKEESISHEMHAKDWNFNDSKILDEVFLLYLIVMLRMKSRNTNQGKVDIKLDK